VVELVLISTGSREEELDAVAAHAVVAGEQGGVPDGSGLAPWIVAGPHVDDDLHHVPGVSPHRRVVRVLDEMMLDGHRDRPRTLSWQMIPETVLAPRLISPWPRAKLESLGEPVWNPHGGIPGTIGIWPQPGL
jgi:hypothetical protein